MRREISRRRGISRSPELSLGELSLSTFFSRSFRSVGLRWVPNQNKDGGFLFVLTEKLSRYLHNASLLLCRRVPEYFRCPEASFLSQTTDQNKTETFAEQMAG